MDSMTIALFLYCSINLAITVGVLADSSSTDRPSWGAIAGSILFGTPLLCVFCLALAHQRISSMLQEI